MIYDKSMQFSFLVWLLLALVHTNQIIQVLQCTVRLLQYVL